MLKSALLGIGLAAALTTAATAQVYYPYSYPGYYPYPAYSYPYGYPAYANGYAPYYAWAWPYPAPAYRPAPAYSDPYVTARPYSDSAGPRASGHVGY
jgi:hypothetical protein